LPGHQYSHLPRKEYLSCTTCASVPAPRYPDVLPTPELGFFDATLTGDVTSRLVADTSQLGDQIALNLNIFLR
jgi:hypothetical protein